VSAFAKEVRDTIIKAVTDDDIEGLLKVYDRKDHVISMAARHLRCVHRKVFISWVVRAMKDPKRHELRDAIKNVIPPINAA
jgi:hypothetical protein